MSEWFENERLWEASFDWMFPARRIDETDAEVQSILALVEGSPRDALDLCCGPGRASIALARRGFAVTGVDRSAFMLEKARERAEVAGVSVEWTLSDMRRFVRPASFDLVLSLFTSFGYFDFPDDNLRVLRNARESLRPGGAMVLELVGKEWLAASFESTGSQDLDGGGVLVQRRRVLDGWDRVETDWYVLGDGRYERFTFRHFVYSGQELKALLLGAGFSSAELYGGFDGRPFIGKSRLHLVARA
ncbi:MAG TPA: class I SAM-dependent methyltransferase [Polyangiaceae bacterium]|jgi:SAM-dependent methyltransferase|nr:class I SAM-dependent methyltransferase [Polyangiaceae bacterium]